MAVVLADEEGGVGMLVFFFRQIHVGLGDEHLHAHHDVEIFGRFRGRVDVQDVAAVLVPVVGVDDLDDFLRAVLGVNDDGGAVVLRHAVEAGVLLAEFVGHAFVRYFGQLEAVDVGGVEDVALVIVAGLHADGEDLRLALGTREFHDGAVEAVAELASGHVGSQGEGAFHGALVSGKREPAGTLEDFRGEVEGAAAGIQDVDHSGVFRVGDGIGFAADVHDAGFRGVLGIHADSEVIDVDGLMIAVAEDIEAELVEEVVVAPGAGDGLAAFHGGLAKRHGQQAAVQRIGVVGVSEIDPFAQGGGDALQGVVVAVGAPDFELAVVGHGDAVFADVVAEVVAGHEVGARGAGGQFKLHGAGVVVLLGGAFRSLANGVQVLVVADDLKAGAACLGIDHHCAFCAADPGRISVLDIAELHTVKFVVIQRGARFVLGLHEEVHGLFSAGAGYGHLSEAVGVAEVVAGNVHGVLLTSTALDGVFQNAGLFVCFPDGEPAAALRHFS